MRANWLWCSIGLGTMAFVGLSCSEDTTAPGATAAVIEDAGGNGQFGIMGAALATPIMVKVTDLDGDGVGGAIVTFAVTGGGGSLERSTVSTDAEGLASTVWMLGSGPDASNQTARATISDGSVPGVAFRATAYPILEQVGGDAQTGEVAQTLAVNPTVVVRDAANNPVAGMPVGWRVKTGGGSVEAMNSVTDAAGEASAEWTLGATVGANVHSLEATVSGTVTRKFVASGVLTAGTLKIVGGDRQAGFSNRFLDSALVVAVQTPAPANRRVAGVEVHWSVTAGGGTVSSDVVVTNAAGTASVDWTVGPQPGTDQGVTASAPGLSGSPVAFVASAAVAPGSITMVSGNNQSGALGTTLPEPLVVLVKDDAGSPLAGATVTWWIYHDWGYGPFETATSTTDSLGHASTLVSLAGTWAWESSVLVTAFVKGLRNQSVSFNASTLPGPPDSMFVVKGNFQTAPAGALLPLPITVEVRDQYGNPTPGVAVLWAAGPGSGSTNVGSSVTDSTGQASTGWTIGTTVGTNNQSATATVPGVAGSPVTFTASATAGP